MSLITIKEDPVVTTQALGATNYQVSFELPARTKSFSIKNRNGNAFKYSWTDGAIALGTYFTIPAGVIFTEDRIHFSSAKKIYLMSTNTDDVLEISYWQ